jgi:hypothetical protein
MGYCCIPQSIQQIKNVKNRVPINLSGRQFYTIGLFGICFVLPFYLATQHGGLLRIFPNISEFINYQTREILSYLAISY